MISWLHVNDKRLYFDLPYQAIKVYQAHFGTNTMAGFIEDAELNIFRSQWTDANGIATYYGLPKTTDLVRSYYHMKHVQDKFVKLVNRYSFYTVRKGQLEHKRRHISFYTVLASGAIDRISRKAVWIDANNHQPVYKLLRQLHNTVAHQISSNKRFHHVILLTSDTENPWHLTKQRHIYSHGHNHGLIGVTVADDEVVRQLDSVIKKDFKAIFGYSLVQPRRNHQKLEPVQPLGYTTGKGRSHHAVLRSGHDHNDSNCMTINAVDSFIRYLLVDYHLQTKDCSFADFMKLSLRQRHILVNTQLNSTKGMKLQCGISAKTANNAMYAYNNYQFVAHDRWAMNHKHITSTEQWTVAQGKSIYSTPNHSEQLDIFSTSRHAHKSTIEPYIIALVAVLAVEPRTQKDAIQKDDVRNAKSIEKEMESAVATTETTLWHGLVLLSEASGIPP